VTGITITSGNGGYVIAPTITFVYNPVNATATATISGGVISATITNPGSGYSYPPSVVVTGVAGDPTTAVAVATISESGSVIGITFASGNTGYTRGVPTITVASPSSFPTYVSDFRDDTADPQLAFNVGDEITITLESSNPGSVWTTPTTSSSGVQSGLTFPLGEMCGALICTPTTSEITVANLKNTQLPDVDINYITKQFGSGSADSIASPSIDINGTFILAGFRFTGITISQSGSNFPAATIELRADIYRGGSVIFQVFFKYIESGATTTTLYIPFSYTEYAKVSTTANSIWVSRIVPTSVYFNQPQNPIFYTGETFSIKLVNISGNNNLNCTFIKTTVSGVTYATGILRGINETLPTITTPSPVINPIFQNQSTNTVITIPKPVSTNTASGFTYVCESEFVSQTRTSSDSSQNCILTFEPFYSGIYRNNSLTAYQKSSTAFSKGSVSYPNSFILINTAERTCVSVPHVGGTLVNFGNYTTEFKACLSQYGNILGFSFQHFGGFTIGSMNTTITFTVTVKNQVTSAQTSFTITIIHNVGAIDKNGTMAYIPFSPQSFTYMPTYVQNITYSPSGGLNQRMTEDPSIFGHVVMVNIIANFSGIGKIYKGANDYLAGALITSSKPNGGWTTASTTYVNNAYTSDKTNLINTSYFSILNQTGYSVAVYPSMVLVGIEIPQLDLSADITFPVTFLLSVYFRTTTSFTLYRYQMKIVIIKPDNILANMSTFTFNCSMPLPGDVGSYEARFVHGYYISEITASGSQLSPNIYLISGINGYTGGNINSGELLQQSYPVFSFKDFTYYNAGLGYNATVYPNELLFVADFQPEIIINSNSYRFNSGGVSRPTGIVRWHPNLELK